jgi:2-(1,2-epoxy-1,2-dihydrophenyl)acetyl-CoA isomerase
MSDTGSAVKYQATHGVANIRFNRPKQLNALNPEVARSFSAAVDEALCDPSVRVIVLSGEGRAFVAGGDLATFKDAADKPKAAWDLIETVHDAVKRLTTGPHIVVASLRGAVAGAGMSLALISDLAIAADDVTFNMGYLKIGASPDGGATWALPRLVGLRRALEIALLSESIDAAAALQLGLVNRVVPAADLEAETQRIASRFVEGPAIAYSRTKRLMRESFERTFREQLDHERDGFAACAATRDFSEALDAFFAKRKPVFGR